MRPAFFLAADTGFICGDGTNDSPYRISYQEEEEKPEESEAPSDWAQSEINEALELGILPDSIRSEWQSPITRLEFCRLAWILYSGLAENEEYSDDFTDTSDLSSEDGAAVSAAAELGIITGYEDGTFRPYDEIMRDEAAAILMRISKLITDNEAVTADDTEFTDCGGIWAREAIEYVCGLGIMRGVESVYEISEATVGKRHIVTFAPYDTYTQEQAVLTVYRLYKRAVENRF
ncbi:MAG: S-layer homology domain-containing protein [Oscillospiraceae bacterium]|nr:S-layer homology domain-containing protein [Oscillospiraceae bacterium]